MANKDMYEQNIKEKNEAKKIKREKKRGKMMNAEQLSSEIINFAFFPL